MSNDRLIEIVRGNRRNSSKFLHRAICAAAVLPLNVIAALATEVELRKIADFYEQQSKDLDATVAASDEEHLSA